MNCFWSIVEFLCRIAFGALHVRSESFKATLRRKFHILTIDAGRLIPTRRYLLQIHPILSPSPELFVDVCHHTRSQSFDFCVLDYNSEPLESIAPLGEKSQSLDQEINLTSNRSPQIIRSTSFAGIGTVSGNSPTSLFPGNSLGKLKPAKGTIITTSPVEAVPSAAANWSANQNRPIQRVVSNPNFENPGVPSAGIRAVPKISNIKTSPKISCVSMNQQINTSNQHNQQKPTKNQVNTSEPTKKPEIQTVADQTDAEENRGRSIGRKSENVRKLEGVKAMRRTQSRGKKFEDIQPVSPNKMGRDDEAEHNRHSFTNSDSGFDSQPGIGLACNFPSESVKIPIIPVNSGANISGSKQANLALDGQKSTGQAPMIQGHSRSTSGVSLASGVSHTSGVSQGAMSLPVTPKSGPAPPIKPQKPSVNVNAIRHNRSASMDRLNGQIRREAKPEVRQPAKEPEVTQRIPDSPQGIRRQRPQNTCIGHPIQRTADLYNVQPSTTKTPQAKPNDIVQNSIPSPSMSRRAFGHGWYKDYMKETKNTFNRLGRSRSRKSSVSSQTSELSDRRSHSSRSLVRSVFSHAPFNDEIDSRPGSITPHQSQTAEIIPRRKEKFQSNKLKFRNSSLDQISAENRSSMHESMMINKEVNRNFENREPVNVPDHPQDSIHESQRTPKPVRASRAREFRRQFNTRSIDDIARDHRKSLHQSMLPNEIIKKDFNAAQDVPDHLELHESQKVAKIKPKKEGKKRFSAIRTLFATSNEKALRGEREVHSSQIAQDDLYLSGGVFASVQDDGDRNGGLRSLLLVLRDGHKLNFIFQGDIDKCEYDECTVNESGRNLFDKQILRFDEILDGHPKFDTEFELQDHRTMIGNLIASFDQTQRNSTKSTLRIFIRNDNIAAATVRSVCLTYPTGDKISFEGNDVQSAFAFLNSRLKSTTVQKVQVSFREEAVPRHACIENGVHDVQDAYNYRGYESDFHEVEDDDVYKLLLARDRPDLEQSKQQPPKLNEIILKN